MGSTCFGHLHVHLQEFLYIQVVSLPHVVLCYGCWGCGPAELVCSLVHCLSVSFQLYKNSWRWTCKCLKHVEAIYENKIIVKLFASSWYISLLIENFLTNWQTISFSCMTWLHEVKKIVLQSQMMDIKTAHLRGHPNSNKPCLDLVTPRCSMS